MRRLLLCLVLGAAAPAAAQTAAAPESAPAALPPWVVPVLRLVSETHVEPTTGIVLSRSGLVLVPGDFATVGDEIVVLDGGNDIVRHGRPARLHSAYPELGLKVLSVPGLSRAGARIAAAPPGDGGTLHLRAFPPAEQIAEGEPPLLRPASAAAPDVGGTPSIAAATPLPNVTGALLDDCGNLAGVSLANGVQSMAPSPGTRYRWLGALRQVLEAVQLPADGIPCPGPAAEQAASAAPKPVEATPAPAARPEPPAAEPASSAVAEADQADAGATPETAAEPPPAQDAGTADPETVSAAPAGRQSPGRFWWWLAGGLVLLAVALVIALAARRRGAAAMHAGSADRSPPPARGSGDAAQAVPQPPLDGRLVLTGRYADGRPFEVGAAVSADAVNLEIGRGSAELVLDSMAVSRRHARLNGSRSELTITDLGSRNGTSIDGVPCLEGEIMYLEPGCTVVLGDVRFTVSIETGPDLP